MRRTLGLAKYSDILLIDKVRSDTYNHQGFLRDKKGRFRVDSAEIYLYRIFLWCRGDGYGLGLSGL